MELQCQLLLYLDKRRYLMDMKNSFEIFLEQLTEKMPCKFPPFRFTMEINVMDLLDVFPDLGDFLLKEPLKLQHMCNEILYACIKETNKFNKSIEFAQVAVNLRLRCLSKLLIRANQRYYTGLVAFEGILLSVSKPASYVYHTVWSCPEECLGNEVILHYFPKTAPKCYVCKSVLFENIGLRSCGEQVTAIFQLNNHLLGKPFIVVDDMIQKLMLGHKYMLHAIALKKTIVIWSLEETVSLLPPFTHPIPSDIEDLYQDCNGISWKFIYCLACSIGVNVCPLNCFMHLKISLLLSLASIKANAATGSSIVHVLVGGYDTGYVAELMTEAAKLANRSILLGTCNTSVSTTLISNTGGVCVMPLPLHIYSQKQMTSILSTIETGEIIIDTMKVKLQTAVWAQGIDFKKIVLYDVAIIFGTICRGDFGEYSDEIADFILKHAIKQTERSKEELEALKDVKVYIDLVAGMEVALDKAAETVLRNYFIAARKEVEKRLRGVSFVTMSVLVATCLTSARLCRRNVANIDDAVFAIWLHVSGGPEPRFAPNEYLQTPANVKNLEKVIDSFKDWLERFTDSYIL